MKALTLTEPWATLMTFGEKNVETRSWSTKYRGLVAIHAAKAMPQYAKEFVRTREVINAFYRAESQPWFQLGYILCVRQLIDVVPTSEVGFHLRALTRYHVLPKEKIFGDYSEGRFAWIFSKHVHVFHPAIKAPEGFHLGLWNWMDHTREEKVIFPPPPPSPELQAIGQCEPFPTLR